LVVKATSVGKNDIIVLELKARKKRTGCGIKTIFMMKIHCVKIIVALGSVTFE